MITYTNVLQEHALPLKIVEVGGSLGEFFLSIHRL